MFRSLGLGVDTPNGSQLRERGQFGTQIGVIVERGQGDQLGTRGNGAVRCSCARNSVDPWFTFRIRSDFVLV